MLLLTLHTDLFNSYDQSNGKTSSAATQPLSMAPNTYTQGFGNSAITELATCVQLAGLCQIFFLDKNGVEFSSGNQKWSKN